MPEWKGRMLPFLLVPVPIVSLAGRAESSFDAGYPDAGQGECSVTKCDGETMVIDSTIQNKEMDVQGAFFSLDADLTDMLAATHPGRDHHSYLDEGYPLCLPDKRRAGATLKRIIWLTGTGMDMVRKDNEL